jgi:hypothetical protein
MKPNNTRSVGWALLCAGVCALGAAASCSQDGVTSSCPPLPRYQTFDLGDASVPDAMSGDSAESKALLAAAVAENCATAPSGASVSTGGGGHGGTSSGGHGGSGGRAGSGGTGGLGGADNAGASGSN